MLWVPQKGIVRVQSNGGTVGVASPGTSATTGGAASTKGTAVELISSTSFDAYWITILAMGYGASTTASEGALDILVGAATEEVLIANLLMGNCGEMGGGSTKGPKRWDFPLYIPAGTRIAAQVAGARVTTAMVVYVEIRGGNGIPPFRVGSKVTTYGMGTVPDGTAITPGATGGTGAWAQIVASTTEDHFAFVPSFQITTDVSTNNRSYIVDLGIGAATEEQIGYGYWFSASSDERMEGPYNSMPTFHDVPSGTRLVMRASNSGTNDGAYNGCIHAVS